MELLQLGATDWVVVGIYFAICHLISIFVKYRRNTNTLEEYFLAGRSMVWIVVACSIFATNVGSHFFIGLAGSAAANGIAIIAYEWHAVWVLLLLGFFFMPIYIRSGVYTVPQYLKLRFQSNWLRVYLAVICVINSLSTKIAFDVYGASLFLKQLVNYDIYLSSFVLLSFTAIYTLIGGLTSVMYVDTMQCVVMICGSLVISIIGLHKVGGPVELWRKFPHALGNHTNATVAPFTTMSPTHNSTVANFTTTPTIVSTRNSTGATTFTTMITKLTSTVSRAAANMASNYTTVNYTMPHNSTITTGYNFTTTMGYNSTTTMLYNSTTTMLPTTTPIYHDCYKVNKNWDHLFRPLDDTDFPWAGVIFSLPITAIWYWCTDQVIVQQALTAKNLLHARRGTIFAGVLKLLPFVIMIIPGMIARVLFPDTIACPDSGSCYEQCGDEHGCTHLAYFKLVADILPQGVIGLMFAMMLAAMMSSISSTFIGVSTVFTLDIWKVIRPLAKDRELLWVGKIVIVAMVAVGMAWVPAVERVNEKDTFLYLQTIQAYIAPSICAVFLTGMLFLQVTEAAVLSSLFLGAVLAIVRFSLDIKFPSPKCGEFDDRPAFMKISFLYVSIFIFVISIVCICVVSICTQPVPLGLLGKLTWKTMNDDRDDDVHETNEMGMDNTNFRHSTEDILDKNKKQDSDTDTSEGSSKFELWEKWISFGALLVVLISLCICFR